MESEYVSDAFSEALRAILSGEPTAIPSPGPMPTAAFPPTIPELPAEVPDLIPARMLNEFTYCPRLGYLEWVDGEFAESVDTLEGTWQHRRVDRPGGLLPSPEPVVADGEEGEPEEEAGRSTYKKKTKKNGRNEEDPFDGASQIHARSVMLSAPRAGLVARMDLVEAEGLTATPVDYKKGEVPDIPSGVWDPEKIQLGAQMLILEENGFTCHRGIIYYVGSKTRVEVPFDERLRSRTLEQIRLFRIIARVPVPPSPLKDSPRCPRCSLVGICLPDEVNLLAAEKAAETTVGYRAGSSLLPAGTPALEGGESAPVRAEQEGALPAETPAMPVVPTPQGSERVRALLASRSDALPLYVQEQGSRVGKTGECLRIELKGAPPREVRLLEVSQVCLYGGVQITTQAVQELLTRGIPLCWLSHGGWFYGIAQGLTHKNIELRRLQFTAAADPQRCLELARSFISSKIRNCRTLLRRNAEKLDTHLLASLRRHIQSAEESLSLEHLLGVEGSAARLYFSAFASMIKVPPEQGQKPFEPDGRNRRPPRDPVNALLSFAYSLLAKDCQVTLQAVGFDPLCGFYHQPRYGRPALALDLMEEFRPIICDSVVITSINNREIRSCDFVRNGGAVNLKPAARRAFLQAYERRMDQLVTHPVFGYRLSYRRVLEVQARLLGRVLTGEIPEYPAFSTR